MSETLFGLHAVLTALERRPDALREIYVLQGRRDKRLQKVLDLAARHQLPITERSREALDKMVSGRHQGVVAVADAMAPGSEKDIPGIVEAAGRDALILVLDGVTDPHNLGACLRSADAAGVQLVIAPKDNSASLNATVSKVACGAAEAVPFVQVTNLARCLTQLQDLGVWIVGMAGEADDSLYDCDLTGPRALVMGAEGSGMRRLTKERCDYLAKLPMAGEVSSLNVSVATGICLFEAVRQRRSL
ncbi:23S rRNA (guanosine(2251)-2'-O)-methyltransferase RlmB [Spongiibacter sp. KMU-166]|uniref:23S rRNA (guanosine-2'-O-)-methyltransferase RlmB n=1 Tax=Spongiibacter thalassae TaxID=2721624 RepID=A0ABX1GM32_9GAMM|nr:23S rRNA (guanosine(2251)-2'-O)-methyltransferase RlmB [Spongiibacter thalassae]